MEIEDKGRFAGGDETEVGGCTTRGGECHGTGDPDGSRDSFGDSDKRIQAVDLRRKALVGGRSNG